MEEGEIMRLSRGEEVGGSLLRLISQAGERRKSWKDDVDKMEEVLGKEGTHGAVMEIYSPPRVNAVAAMWGLPPGWSIDFTIDDPDDGMPWDFDVQEKRDKAERMVKDKKGLLIIGSPLCSANNQLRMLSKGKIGCWLLI